MLYGKELAQSIQKRCKIQPGMLVKSSAGTDGKQNCPRCPVVSSL